MRALLLVTFVMLLGGCPSEQLASSKEPSKGASSVATTTTEDAITTITDPSQREAAVDKPVVVIGIQTRTKQPQVNGVDVDGGYELSDKKVVARGVLRKTVVPERKPAKDELPVASRGAGTYYSVVDTATKTLAKTKLAE